MLYLYLGSLAFGGALVGASAFLGDADADFDADMDADLDVDADVDADADADADGDSDSDLAGAALAWLPFASMRFWTFFFAFGGLTGALMTGFGLGGAVLTGAVAAGTGYVSGIGMTRVVRALKSQKVSSAIGAGDYIGASARVLLPVNPNAAGQVALELRGRSVARAARSDDDDGVGIGGEVFVLDVDEDGTLVVTARDPMAA